ncbi:MAG: class I SAM-dependent methyltransferase [Ignavibacteriae bacterium]|nr:class I SAM-dependent methyltransferase [Ignavibacteriota bacterium]MCB9208314.1 class I SAM-dependent methyltransferase [Ignavibacteriales bacterium]MCB9259076.1 class I SAM-dependent methyltransferase [Ignavibacteriales bacterium]
MNNFWDERYSSNEYVYGIEPNEFYKSEINKLKIGKILFPAEGEGRNAVYASKLGWNVTAFDSSVAAKQKADKLANDNNVKINYLVSDYEKIELQKDYFDCLVLIFAHSPQHLRESIHKKLLNFLKPTGTIILQGFSKDQINKSSGGPKNVEMLFSKEELEKDFGSLSKLRIEEKEIYLNEGPFHEGNASVINLVGIK